MNYNIQYINENETKICVTVDNKKYIFSHIKDISIIR